MSQQFWIFTFPIFGLRKTLVRKLIETPRLQKRSTSFSIILGDNGKPNSSLKMPLELILCELKKKQSSMKNAFERKRESLTGTFP